MYAGVLELSRLSKEDFCYPLHRNRLQWIDYPDVFLLASIIMVTKLLFPFKTLDESKMDDVGEAGTKYISPNFTTQSICMDWNKWQAVYKDSSATRPASRLSREDIAKLRPQDVWTLTEDQIDDYMDWQQQYHLTDKEGVSVSHYTKFFERRENRLTDRFDGRPPTLVALVPFAGSEAACANSRRV